MNGVDEYTKDDLTDKVTNLERENRKLKKMLKKSYDTPKDPWKQAWKEEDLGEIEEEQLDLPLDLDYDMDNGAQVCKTHEFYDFNHENPHFLLNYLMVKLILFFVFRMTLKLQQIICQFQWMRKQQNSWIMMFYTKVKILQPQNLFPGTLGTKA